jgi:hypothetical protein
MEACSFWIEKNWIADLDIDVAVANRIVCTHTLAQSLRPALQQSKPDPVTERRRESDRRHIALIIVCCGAGADRQEVRSRAQTLLPVRGFESDEGRPVWRTQCGLFGVCSL